ncbi:MAG: phenylacetic acid degradation bifunctional protein PaaZ [Bacteroidetes bacterium]|nr:phenylacetic acid degradation bifunctional protein PaaZ [Bacteroidota bacterium]
MKIESYINGNWINGSGSPKELHNAVNGSKVAEVCDLNNFDEAVIYARQIGGKNLRKFTIHERANILKELGKYLSEKKKEFYKLSAWSGATKSDSWLDIDGGLGTLFTISSKARKELSNKKFHLEGGVEELSKGGTFKARHLMLPLEGVALHINAFNFPTWGMLEKFAPTFIAGMPSIIKPATQTCYVAFGVVKEIINSGILPEGSLQLICGSAGNIFDYLNCQDVVTFTGSQSTGLKLRTNKNVQQNSIRFNMEADSLNCSILGKDAIPGSDEFNLYIDEIIKEMKSKTGQRCTAIRRAIVPNNFVNDVIENLKKRISEIIIGDPSESEVMMGPLVSKMQASEVDSKVSEIQKNCELAFTRKNNLNLKGLGIDNGSFFSPTLLYCKNPNTNEEVHSIEAFGPVTTVMGYENVDELCSIVKKGNGSLVASCFTDDDLFAREIVYGIGSYHGRLMFVNKYSAKESTGHGSPMPHLVHGGPGRAGGGEELGGSRSVLHYMQRVAVQASPNTLMNIADEFVKGAEKDESIHPFKKYFEELKIGDSVTTKERIITEEDILNFTNLSGDHFYAHKEDDLAMQSIFGRRVAHGYFVLSAAAGLFVWPNPGPVLANYGLENLRFIKPVFPNDSIYVQLTCKNKQLKIGDPNGIVHWDVVVKNQFHEDVALYTLLTLVKRKNN